MPTLLLDQKLGKDGKYYKKNWSKRIGNTEIPIH